MGKDREFKITKFTEQMGLVFAHEGLPRIAGKIYALLLVEKKPYSLVGLADRLRVSRGSVSTNTRLLEGLGMIERYTLPGDRQHYFQMANDPHSSHLRGTVQRITRAKEMVDDTEKALFADGEPNPLRDLSEFYSVFISGYESILASLQDRKEKEEMVEV